MNIPESGIDSKLLERILKLKRHADSAEAVGNVEEALAFAAGVQRLLAEHELEMEDVLKLESAGGEELDFQAADVKEQFQAKRTKWEMALALCVAEMHGCAAAFAPDTNMVYFVGKRMNRMAAAYVLGALHRFAEAEVERALLSWQQTRDTQAAFRAAERIVADGGFTGGTADGRTTRSFQFFGVDWGRTPPANPKAFRASWLEGFSQGIYQRLQAEKRRASALQQRGMALVSSAQRQAEEHAAELGVREAQASDVPKPPPAQEYHPDAHEEGIAAAHRAPLAANAVEEGAPNRQLENPA